MTETLASHPESQATERITVDDDGASTLISSDFVVLESTVTARGRPLLVAADTGFGGLAKV